MYLFCSFYVHFRVYGFYLDKNIWMGGYANTWPKALKTLLSWQEKKEKYRKIWFLAFSDYSNSRNLCNPLTLNIPIWLVFSQNLSCKNPKILCRNFIFQLPQFRFPTKFFCQLNRPKKLDFLFFFLYLNSLFPKNYFLAPNYWQLNIAKV